MKRVHAMADCRDCDFHCGDFTKAQTEGQAHSRKTGHTVSVEVGLAQHYINGVPQFK